MSNCCGDIEYISDNSPPPAVIVSVKAGSPIVPVNSKPALENAALVQAIKDDLPSVGVMVKNLVASAIAAIGDGVHRVEPEEYARRIMICAKCENLYPQEFRCAKCGCFMKLKTYLAAWHCPLDKW